jgi:zona occludens toxin (predicted ATPase)
VLAHLASTERYHHACLDDTLSDFLQRGLDAGAIDVATFNEWGIRGYDARPPAEILAEWRDANARTRATMRARDGGTMTTMVPDYPVRRQAFHVASELATHADDVGVPVAPAEASARTEWRVRFSRFVLAEEGRRVEVIVIDGRNRVRAGPVEADLSDAELVEAVAGRLEEQHALPASLREGLSTAV